MPVRFRHQRSPEPPEKRSETRGWRLPDLPGQCSRVRSTRRKRACTNGTTCAGPTLCVCSVDEGPRVRGVARCSPGKRAGPPTRPHGPPHWARAWCSTSRCPRPALGCSRRGRRCGHERALPGGWRCSRPAPARPLLGGLLRGRAACVHRHLAARQDARCIACAHARLAEVRMYARTSRPTVLSLLRDPPSSPCYLTLACHPQVSTPDA